MRLILFGALCLMINWAKAQPITQKVRGVITDIETNQPLIGVNVVLLSDSDKFVGTTTDVDGRFRLEQVPVGRQSISFSFIGYQPQVLSNVEVKSGRETILDIKMEEAVFEMEAFEVSATRRGETVNEMALISARQFSVAETERYAGSRGEPSRMASNFAGVQGADDSRNDIVIRGNSPQAILWRVNDVNVYNPNHFNIPGTAGGSVSILNNKTLANSDFFTGAFPAEYGNANAGVFDVRLRNGNNEQHEFIGQLGFLGVEGLAEGPINRDARSSYLAQVRYSSLSLFSSLGIDIGTSAVPRYADGSFNLSFPGKGKGSWSIFGVGGWSKIDILISDQERPDRNIYGDNDRDQYFGSTMSTVGVSHTRPVGEKAYWKTTIAHSYSQVDSYHELVYRRIGADSTYTVDSLKPLLDYTFREQKISLSTYVNWKLNSRNVLKAGIFIDQNFFQFVDSTWVIDSSAADFQQWRTRWDSDETGLLVQPYIQWKHRMGLNWTYTLGLHSQWFSLNNSAAWVEPRVAVRRTLPKGQSLSGGFGLHSQLQPSYLYFYGARTDATGNPKPQNMNMGMTKSLQGVLGYENTIKESFRLKVETYYQWLYDIPVSERPSSFSLANTGSGFERFFPDSLVNEGNQRNYGIELTMEKFFSQGYYFLLTGSLFQSEYIGSDGVWRNTDFNGNYAFNALASRDFKLSQNARLTIGAKVTQVGGRWYGPADIAESNRQRELVVLDSARNTLQFEDYFRFDLKVNYRLNKPKFTHEIGIDMVNVLDTQNVLALTYAPDESNDPNESIRKEYQLGRLPLFYYRIEF